MGHRCTRDYFVDDALLYVVVYKSPNFDFWRKEVIKTAVPRGLPSFIQLKPETLNILMISPEYSRMLSIPEYCGELSGCWPSRNIGKNLNH